MARGQHSSQQPDDQNEMLLQSSGATETAMEEFASGNFDQGQKHQRGQSQRHQKILCFPEPAEAAAE